MEEWRNLVFALEAELQSYFFDNPDALSLEMIKEGAQALVLDREFPVSSGSIDLLAIDNDGDIYVVEARLYRNPAKRFALAQVLDYVAALWSTYDSPHAFIERIDEKLRQRVGMGLIEKLEQTFGSAEDMVSNVKHNLSDRVFRFIILMDQVPLSLRDLILSCQSQ